MMQQTSLKAYKSIQEQLGQKQKQVLRTIQKLVLASNKQISKTMQQPINTITPRTLELRKLGLVTKWGTRTCEQTGRKETIWKAT